MSYWMKLVLHPYAIPYIGKVTVTGNNPAGEFVVGKLSESI